MRGTFSGGFLLHNPLCAQNKIAHTCEKPREFFPCPISNSPDPLWQLARCHESPKWQQQDEQEIKCRAAPDSSFIRNCPIWQRNGFTRNFPLKKGGYSVFCQPKNLRIPALDGVRATFLAKSCCCGCEWRKMVIFMGLPTSFFFNGTSASCVLFVNEICQQSRKKRRTKKEIPKVPRGAIFSHLCIEEARTLRGRIQNRLWF